MKKHVFRLVMFSVAIVLSFTTGAFAKVEWEILKNIILEDAPRDIAISKDGATAYILCSKGIQIYSVRANKVTGSIPFKDDFSQIAISPDGEKFFLTKTKGKEVSIIQISQAVDIPTGNSQIIGKKDASVTFFAFLDYQ